MVSVCCGTVYQEIRSLVLVWMEHIHFSPSKQARLLCQYSTHLVKKFVRALIL